jgi:hypothetical protein
MEKPWMPVVAGILDIVSGAMGVAMGLFMALHLHAARAIQAAPRFAPNPGVTLPQMPPIFFPGMGLALGIALIVLGALAIVGGIHALKVKAWGLALAGAIAGVITGRLLGIVALIFIVLGRKDFQKS